MSEHLFWAIIFGAPFALAAALFAPRVIAWCENKTGWDISGLNTTPVVKDLTVIQKLNNEDYQFFAIVYNEIKKSGKQFQVFYLDDSLGIDKNEYDDAVGYVLKTLNKLEKYGLIKSNSYIKRGLNIKMTGNKELHPVMMKTFTLTASTKVCKEILEKANNDGMYQFTIKFDNEYEAYIDNFFIVRAVKDIFKGM